MIEEPQSHFENHLESIAKEEPTESALTQFGKAVRNVGGYALNLIPVVGMGYDLSKRENNSPFRALTHALYGGIMITYLILAFATGYFYPPLLSEYFRERNIEADFRFVVKDRKREVLINRFKELSDKNQDGKVDIDEEFGACKEMKLESRLIFPHLTNKEMQEYIDKHPPQDSLER